MNIKPLRLDLRSSLLIKSCEIKMNVTHSNVACLSSSPRLLGGSASVIIQVCFHGGYPPVTRNTATAIR